LLPKKLVASALNIRAFDIEKMKNHAALFRKNSALEVSAKTSDISSTG